MMKMWMSHGFVLLLSMQSLISVTAADVNGVVTSKQNVKASQTPVVVWVEGLTGGVPQTNEPLISQSGVQFSPRVLGVAAGQTVSFPNDDDVAHNVFSMSQAKKFKLGIYPKGETREVTFEKPGVIDLFCSIHRHMHAVVVVAPSHHFAQTELDKAFTIQDVPPGTYVVKVWNSKFKTTDHELVVPETGDAELNIVLE